MKTAAIPSDLTKIVLTAAHARTGGQETGMIILIRRYSESGGVTDQATSANSFLFLGELRFTIFGLEPLR